VQRGEARPELEGGGVVLVLVGGFVGCRVAACGSLRLGRGALAGARSSLVVVVVAVAAAATVVFLLVLAVSIVLLHVVVAVRGRPVDPASTGRFGVGFVLSSHGNVRGPFDDGHE
jgi:hypothetical protein